MARVAPTPHSIQDHKIPVVARVAPNPLWMIMKIQVRRYYQPGQHLASRRRKSETSMSARAMYLTDHGAQNVLQVEAATIRT